MQLADLLEVVTGWGALGTLVVPLALRFRSRSLRRRLRIIGATRWVWTALAVVGVLALILNHGAASGEWLITALALFQALLTHTSHVLAVKAQKENGV